MKSHPILLLVLVALLMDGSLGWILSTVTATSTPSAAPAPTPMKTGDEELSAFEILAGNIHCLVKSDLKRQTGLDGSSTGWTSWVQEYSAFRMQRQLTNSSFCHWIKQRL
jgi:hypothetical protein